jgi:hypothetical protein
MNLNEIVSEMRIIGEQLIPYNYPLADRSVENFLNNAKVKSYIIDGYDVFLHYSKSDYKKHLLESVQIYSKFSPFLPFNLIVKIGKKFLGSSNLMLAEHLREGQKIYCWTVILDRRGRPILDNQYIEASSEQKYENFSYYFLNRAAVNTH